MARPLRSESRQAEIRRRFHRVARIAGVTAIVAGVAVIIGWKRDSTTLVRLTEGFIPMSPTTALAFVLTGMALLLLHPERISRARRALGQLFAALVGVFAAIVLAEYLTGRDMGVTGLLLWLHLPVGPVAGWISFNAAANFLMLSAALLSLNLRARLRPTDVLVSLVLLTCVIASSSYVFGAIPVYGLPGKIPLTGMALHTALTMLLVGIGILCARPSLGLMSILASEHAGGEMVRPLATGAVAIPVVGILVIAGERNGMYGPELVAPIAIAVCTFIGAALSLRAARRLNDTDRRRREAERLAIELEQGAVARQRFFADLSARLTESLDLQLTLENAARACVPYLADWAVIDVVEPSGSVRHAVILHADPSRRGQISELVEMTPAPLPIRDGVLSALKSDAAILVRDIDADWVSTNMGDPRRAALVTALGLRSYIVVALRARGRVLGALIFIAADRNFTDDEVRLTEEVARRAALAADNARLYEAARAAIRTREDVLAVVSHDLRNPLNAVRLGLQLIERRLRSLAAPLGPPGRELHKPLGDVQRAVKRALRLLDDLLDFATIESGSLRVEFEEHPVRQILDEMLELMRPLAAERQIRIAAFAPEDLFARCDRARILQVLENLVGNAIKFSGEGSVVSVRAHLAGRDAVFTVRDQGTGISPDDVAHIFDRYWQPRRAHRQGVGLGLAIARGIIEAHGGTIQAESSLGVGSTFTFTVSAVERYASAPPEHLH